MATNNDVTLGSSVNLFQTKIECIPILNLICIECHLHYISKTLCISLEFRKKVQFLGKNRANRSEISVTRTLMLAFKISLEIFVTSVFKGSTKNEINPVYDKKKPAQMTSNFHKKYCTNVGQYLCVFS